MNALKQEIARILLEIEAVTFRPDKPFTWASGIQSPVYCDNRLLMAYPDARRSVREAFRHILKEEAIPCELVAGVATGAIPHAAWLAERLVLPLVYVRTKPKEHGKENLVEGKITPAAKTILIEDLISTGQSSAAAVEALRDAGASCNYCLAIFNYTFLESAKRFQEIQCEVRSLTDFPTLLQIAKERRLIRADQIELLKKFSEDPWHWREENR